MRQGWISLVLLVGCGDVKHVTIDAAPHNDTAGHADAAVDSPPAGAPTVVTVNAPTSMDAEGGIASISATVHGTPNSMLTVAFQGTLGTFGPVSTMVTTGSTGDGVTSTMFTSGTSTGTAMATVVATDASNVSSAPKNFSFNIVALSRYGLSTNLGNQGNFGANFLLGESINIPVSGHIKKFGFISAVNGPMMQMALYQDVGGAPAGLVAQLPATNIVAGVNEVAISPIQLAAGNYWIMGLMNTQGGIEQGPLGSMVRPINYISLTFGSTLPNPFPASHSNYQGPDINYYVVMGQ